MSLRSAFRCPRLRRHRRRADSGSRQHARALSCSSRGCAQRRHHARLVCPGGARKLARQRRRGRAAGGAALRVWRRAPCAHRRRTCRGQRSERAWTGGPSSRRLRRRRCCPRPPLPATELLRFGRAWVRVSLRFAIFCFDWTIFPVYRPFMDGFETTVLKCLRTRTQNLLDPALVLYTS